MKTFRASSFIFFILLFASTAAFAQKPPGIQWQKCLGGKGDDIPQCIIQTSDGGYAVAGYTSSTDGDVSGIYRDETQLYSQLPDGWIVKLDPSGNIVWQKCVGGTGYDYLHSIIQTSDGGFIVAGETRSTDGDAAGHHGVVYYDAWVVKLDSTGNVEWSKCYGGNGDTFVTSIIRASGEGRGYIFAGYTDALDGDVSGNHDSTVYPDTFGDAWIVKISDAGNILWQKCFGGKGDDGAESIVAAPDGGYVFAGVTTSTDGDVVGKHPGSRDSAADAWIVKLNSSGTLEWQKCLGGSAQDYAFSITNTGDKGFVFLALTQSSDGDVHPSKGTGGDWLVKLNSLGAIQWQRSTPNSDFHNYGYGMVTTASNSDILVTESITQKYDTTYHGAQGGNDVFIGRYDSAGNTIWEKQLGGHLEDIGISGASTFDGGVIVAATTNSTDGDVLGYHYDILHYYFNDEWIVMLNGHPSGVGNTNPDVSQNQFARIYPNPSADQVHLQLSAAQTIRQVEFYDVMGRKFFPSCQLNENGAAIDVHELLTGTYAVHVTYIDDGVFKASTLSLVVQH